jgi:hypothetical protein
LRPTNGKADIYFIMLAFAAEMVDNETGARAVAYDLCLKVPGSNLGRTLRTRLREYQAFAFKEVRFVNMTQSLNFCGFRDTPQKM